MNEEIIQDVPSAHPKLTPDQLEAIELDSGDHSSPSEGHCLLEVVSMFAGEVFTDQPKCVDPVLVMFGQRWNDLLPDKESRRQLKQYIPRLVGTNRGSALSEFRGRMTKDWLIRVHLPIWLDRSEVLSVYASHLRKLPPVLDEGSLASSISVLVAVSEGSACKATMYTSHMNRCTSDAARKAAYLAAWGIDSVNDYSHPARAAFFHAMARATIMVYTEAYERGLESGEDPEDAAERKIDELKLVTQAAAHELFDSLIKAKLP